MELLKNIFSNFGIFLGVYLLVVLVELVVVNTFKLIINLRKMKCAEQLSKDGKSVEEIEKLLGGKKNNLNKK